MIEFLICHHESGLPLFGGVCQVPNATVDGVEKDMERVVREMGLIEIADMRIRIRFMDPDANATFHRLRSMNLEFDLSGPLP